MTKMRFELTPGDVHVDKPIGAMPATVQKKPRKIKYKFNVRLPAMGISPGKGAAVGLGLLKRKASGKIDGQK